MLQTGIKGHAEEIVSQEKTAEAVGSGELPVYATPALAALAEMAAWQSVAGELAEGQGTVGTKLTLSHLSATPVGCRVWCDTELVVIDRRRLVFSVEVFDEAGKVAEGTQERFVVENARFLGKAEQKRSKVLPGS